MRHVWRRGLWRKIKSPPPCRRAPKAHHARDNKSRARQRIARANASRAPAGFDEHARCQSQDKKVVRISREAWPRAFAP
jgi:hypothetical protein